MQQLRRTNLDLLPVLHELLRHRNLTAAARALGISQPAVSNALRELRTIFEDDLLVSLGRQAQLTDRAKALVEPLTRILTDLGVFLEPVERFDPLSEPLHIVIRTADYVSVILAPLLVQMCAEEAPGVDFHFVDRSVGNLEQLDTLDFFIVPRPLATTLGKTIGSMPLWRDEMTCIVSDKDSRWGEVITPDEFRAARHVAYAAGDQLNPAVAALLQPTAGLEVAPVCEITNFLVIGAIVEQAKCVAIVPRRLADVLVRDRDLRIVPIDFPNRTLDIDVLWSARAGARRGHAWVRDLIGRAAEGLNTSGADSTQHMSPRR
jgi:DNA-binding transcriptional LysR family regulator